MKPEPSAHTPLVVQITADSHPDPMLSTERRRQLLFSARMRFSPETQSVRQTAVDRIIEQNLSLCDSGVALSVREIQEKRIVAMPDGTAVFPREDCMGS